MRVWSAACATGEEPYSIGMCLLAKLRPDEGWTHEIIGTDISERALERARSATWPINQSGQIPEQHLRAFMLKGVDANEGLMRAAPDSAASSAFENSI